MQPIDWNKVSRDLAKSLEPMIWKLKNSERAFYHLPPLSFEEWQALRFKALYDALHDIELELDVMQEYVDSLRVEGQSE